jgi:ABC-type glycerol-3-phosphate transport system permease component
MRRDPDRLLPRPVGWLVLGLISIFVLVPVLFLLIVSVTPASQVSLGTLIPTTLEFANYLDIWSTVALGRGMINSLLICGVAGLLAVIVGTFAAFPLERFRFRGRRPFLYSVIGIQLIPGTMLLLPLFAVFAFIQVFLGIVVIGSYWALMLTYLTFSLPFAIWLMVAYLRTIPRELEEAAMVDGLSQFKALLRVTMPLALPGMIVAFVFAFLLGWNDVLFASVLTNDTTRTLAVDLQVFSFNQDGLSVPQYGQLMAAGVVAAVPVVTLYLVLQRYLVGGLTLGGVK